MSKALTILIRKLREHSRLTAEDLGTINALSHTVRDLKSNEDLIRQGDDPDVSAVVVSGMVARYHLLPDGARQYLSFHMTGDMPDSQALFIDRMDHAVCAIGPALIASIPHKELLAAFNRRPSVGFAIWRETLIDAAIFREAITNNSARAMPARMGHLFCELFYRASASGLTEGNMFAAPISLVQLGETLGMSIASVNRTLQELRASGAARVGDDGVSKRPAASRRLGGAGQISPVQSRLSAFEETSALTNSGGLRSCQQVPLHRAKGTGAVAPTSIRVQPEEDV